MLNLSTPIVPAITPAVVVTSGDWSASVLRAACSTEPEAATRKQFRTLSLKLPGSLAVAHLISNQQRWLIDDQYRSGRGLPAGEVDADMTQLCQTAIRRGSVLQQHRPATADDAATVMYLVPIDVLGGDAEVLGLMVLAAEDGFPVRQGIETIGRGLQLWKQNLTARSNDWKLASLAALIELTDRIDTAADFDTACQLLVNDFAAYIDCANVAVGWRRGEQITVQAISGDSDRNSNSATVQAMNQVMQEACLRERPGRWSLQAGGSDQPLLMLHKTLAYQLQVECVVSWPMVNGSGQLIGCWLFAGAAEPLLGDRFQRLLEVATPRIATALSLADRQSPGRWRRYGQKIYSAVQSRTSVIVAAISLLLAGLLMIPVPYSVRTAVEARPEQRRFAVAPFAGQIEVSLARVGDQVTAGQVLARMDGRELRWRRTSVAAERETAVRRREVELASRKAAEAMLADLDIARFQAEEAVLQHQLDQLEIRSPVAGVVLSGSNERAEAASVTIGQPLFEIGSLQPILLELAVVANDAAEVRPGQAVTIWMEGQEGRPLEGVIDLVRPVSEERLSRNVFIAEVQIDNTDGRVRPGMAGRAQIQGDRHALGWNLFHKPWNYVRSRMYW